MTRSGDRGREHQRRIAGGTRALGQPDLSAAQDHARRDALVGRWLARRERPTPGFVAQPGHRAPGGGDISHHHVGVVPPTEVSGLVLILETQDVTRPSCRLMQRNSGPQQCVVAVLELRLVGCRNPQAGYLCPPQRLHVADTAMAVFEIGFEVVGHVGGTSLPFHGTAVQLLEVATAGVAPQPFATRPQLIDEVVVAREGAGRQCSGCGVEVVASQRQLLVDMAHAVSQRDPRVPDRVPDRAGRRLDLLGDLARFHVVDQHHVEVAERSEFTSAISTDRDEGEARRPVAVLLDRGVEQRSQPFVGQLGKRLAVRAATTFAVVGGIDEMTLAV